MVETTELWLVRHGQTDWNVERRFQGQNDIPLNKVGLGQARELAEKLVGNRFEAIYSSDLLRAWQTAEIIGQHLGLDVRRESRLREIHHGIWSGMLFEEVERYNQEKMQESRQNPALECAPEGESVIEVAARTRQAVEEFSARHAPGPVLVVSHGVTLAALVCQALNIPLTEVYSHIPKNTEVKVIQWQRR